MAPVVRERVARGRVRPHVRQRLGFDIRRFPMGIAIGLCGMLIAMPLVYSSMVVAEWVYQRVRYVHPSAHELLRTIGQTPDALIKNLAIIALTAKAMKADREKCIEAGASDYIAKPLDMDQLLSMLRVWLYRRKAAAW